jgi:hypothetical protein
LTVPAHAIFAISGNSEILRDMTADKSISPLSPEEWRSTFLIAIRQLAGDSQLQATDWTTRAQAQHGHRNPVEVVHEEWASGKR